jgi:hypothetical protein
MWPLGGGDNASRQNQAGPAAPLAGEGGWGKEELTMARFWSELGPRSCLWGGVAESGGGRRWSGFSGEMATTTEQSLVVEAHVDAKGAFGVFGWH